MCVCVCVCARARAYAHRGVLIGLHRVFVAMVCVATGFVIGISGAATFLLDIDVQACRSGSLSVSVLCVCVSVYVHTRRHTQTCTHTHTHFVHRSVSVDEGQICNDYTRFLEAASAFWVVGQYIAAVGILAAVIHLTRSAGYPIKFFSLASYQPSEVHM